MEVSTDGAGGRLEWYGEEVHGMVSAKMRRRVIVATAVLKAAVQNALNMHATRTAGPSKPGQIPHRYDGLLIKSIYSQIHPDVRHGTEGRVGTKLGYGVFHETTLRPFLRPTLEAQRNVLKAILVGRF